jgi:predicted permease
VVSTFAVLALTMALIGAGHLLARQGVLGPERNRKLSTLLTDGAFPMLCLSRISAMDGPTLRARVVVPLVMGGLLVTGALTGDLFARVLGLGREARRSVRFCVAMPNWIFLPLPIVLWRYGAPGAQVVLLGNVGAQLFLWTVGVLLLAGRSAENPLRLLARNMGLWGTAGGIALSLAGYTYPTGDVARGLRWCADRFGESAVWLTPVTVGAQLGGSAVAKVDRAVGAVLAMRLVIMPLAVAAAIPVLTALGLVALDPLAREVVVLISAMPVAFSASALALRFGADATLAARAVLLSTLLSIVSVPLVEGVAKALFFR